MANTESFIVGSEKLISIFGCWPSFHDAEVLDVHLWRGDVDPHAGRNIFPVLTIKLHVWQLTNEVNAQGHRVLRNHTLATLRFQDVLDFKMEGFNQRNAILGLSIAIRELSHRPWPHLFLVQVESAYGMGASFRCSRIEVLDATPWLKKGAVDNSPIPELAL